MLNLVFDLDGTLIDSRMDIARSVNSSLRALGLPLLETDQILTWVGDGADTLIRLSLNAAGEDLSEEALEALFPRLFAVFMDHYQSHCLEATQPYASVEKFLQELTGHRLAILTNKPQSMTDFIVQGLGWKDLFSFVIGGGEFPPKPDPSGLNKILTGWNAAPSETVMIGDGIQDSRVARGLGCGFIGFLGGIGNPEALKAESPDAVFRHFDELPQILSSWTQASHAGVR
jgi:phosphoglycolate phosphatase